MNPESEKFIIIPKASSKKKQELLQNTSMTTTNLIESFSKLEVKESAKKHNV